MTLTAWNLDRCVYLDSGGCKPSTSLFRPSFGKKGWLVCLLQDQFPKQRQTAVCFWRGLQESHGRDAIEFSVKDPHRGLFSGGMSSSRRRGRGHLSCSKSKMAPSPRESVKPGTVPGGLYQQRQCYDVRDHKRL